MRVRAMARRGGPHGVPARVAARGRGAVAVLALAGLLAAAALGPRAGLAQDQPRPEPPAEALPPEPPPAPPAPPRLAPEGAALAPSSPAAAPSYPPGMAALPDGGVRIALAGAAPDPAQLRALEALGRALAALPAGRITVEAQVSGPANDVSMARRASLARAQAVKAALVAGGLPATRIDLRPLGRLAAGADRVDVLPPGVASPNAEARGR
jgi:outer membrane protein OmpA-like peptidoglycan-associated protein